MSDTNKAIRVAVVDPSCFTMPYDHCLCEGLVRQGCHTLFVGSENRYTSWNYLTHYKRWNHFYRVTNTIYKRPSGIGRKYIKGIEHLFDMGRLVRRLQKWRPHIIHFQWLPVPEIDRRFLPSLKKLAPLIMTVHDTQPFHGSPSSPVQLLGWSNMFRHFDMCIAHTEFSRRQLIERFGIGYDKVAVIPHGVFDYYKEQQSKRTQEQVADETKTILFWGTIKPYKGLDILIEAFAQLSQEVRRNTRLLVAGYPQMPIEPLQELAERKGIKDRITWDLRFIPEEEVPGVFQKAHVIALPYHRIDQSGVLMTALAFGKPIVATRVGGFIETLQDGVHGYLVDSGDPAVFAKAMETILTNPELSEKMGREIKLLANTVFSWDTIAGKTMKVYEEAIRQRNSR